MPDIHQLLKTYFGYDSFRPLQQEIIESVLKDLPTLALLPTGGGKSLCYQIPALAMDGICLVITPLIALMKDQLRQLRKRNISALAIHSGMTAYEVKKTLENAASGHFKFLFVSPERLQTALFQEWLPAIPVNLITVDEAHCISQWGHDFRPAYRQISDALDSVSAPMLALTASATPEVQEDIVAELILYPENIIRQSFEKPNLSFSVFNEPHKMQKLENILQQVPGTALVYCRNRRRTREIAELLQLKGIDATYYHAGLSTDERNKRQDDWLQNRVRVMACTNAFGMGIDKPDVRVVVHMDTPDCLESYYQEAGRAGRDGKKAYAVLLYNDDELKALVESADKKFPPIELIRNLYQAVCDFLQIPVGVGRGQYFAFDMYSFCERFKQDAGNTVRVLKTLSQAGYLSFNETVFVPSKVSFDCSKEYLYQFEEDQPLLEPLIKALLRNYEGIFDNVVSVQEKRLAKICNMDEAEIVKQLQLLNHYRIIRYEPMKDSPQIYFLYERIPAGQVKMEQPSYDRRKAGYKHRVSEMIRYATDGALCRSEMLRVYFGDTDIKPCGICDTCLQNKQRTPKAGDLKDAIQKLGEALLQHHSLPALKQHTKLSASLLQAAVDALLSEEKIECRADGSFWLL